MSCPLFFFLSSSDLGKFVMGSGRLNFLLRRILLGLIYCHGFHHFSLGRIVRSMGTFKVSTFAHRFVNTATFLSHTAYGAPFSPEHIQSPILFSIEQLWQPDCAMLDPWS
jgi:hypothetical protein